MRFRRKRKPVNFIRKEIKRSRKKSIKSSDNMIKKGKELKEEKSKSCKRKLKEGLLTRDQKHNK